MERQGLAPATIGRRFTTVAGFNRYATLDRPRPGVLGAVVLSSTGGVGLPVVMVVLALAALAIALRAHISPQRAAA